MPFFSVIIPTYNRAHVLGRAIKSVLEQTFIDFELIVVDDGSTDDTGIVVSNFNDARIRYLFQKNKAVCAARNHGAQIAQGEYLLFLDSDDYISSVWLQDFFNDIVTKQADIVICRTKLITKPNSAELSFLAGAFTLKRKMFYEIGMYDENLRFGENTELKWRLDAGGYTISTIDKINIFYDNSSNGGSVNKANRIEFFYYVIEKHKELFQKHKRWAQLLYQIAGVSCFQSGRLAEGRRLLWNGYFKKPFNAKSFARALWYSFRSAK